MTGLIDFSTDPNSNDTSAPPILWGEGQPAKTVNNSARALMAALACWRDDNTGALVATRGAGDVYTLSTAQGFSATALTKAHTLAFTVSAKNQGPVTLSVDGGAAKPCLRRVGVDLGPGDMTAGTIYAARYLPSAGAYLLMQGIGSPGKIEVFASVAAIPSGYVECDGSAVSRAAYKALFEAIGETHGAGDGSTTFNLPDANGRTIFGRDNAKGRLTGAGGLAGTVGAVGGSEVATVSIAQLPKHSHGGSTDPGGAVAATTTGAGGDHDHGATTGSGGAHGHTASSGAAGGHTHTATAATGGDHNHAFGYNLGTVNGGTGAVPVTGVGATGTTTTGTANNGSHTHGITVDAVVNHSHSVTVDATGNHTHVITAAPTHTHTIPSVAAHTHSLTTSEVGNGDAHRNMPPGLVGVWAIKA